MSNAEVDKQKMDEVEALLKEQFALTIEDTGAPEYFEIGIEAGEDPQDIVNDYAEKYDLIPMSDWL